MGDWLNSLTEWFQSIWSMLVGFWDWTIGGGAIRDGVAWLASVLPEPTALAESFHFVTDAVTTFIPWLTVIAMVVPVHLGLLVAGLVLVTEIALAAPRIIAWVVKVLPFA